MSIVLILMGFSHKLWQNNRFVYPLTIAGTGCVSVVYSLDTVGVPLGVIGQLFCSLPLYSMGFSWVSVALVALLVSLVVNYIAKRK